MTCASGGAEALPAMPLITGIDVIRFARPPRRLASAPRPIDRYKSPEQPATGRTSHRRVARARQTSIPLGTPSNVDAPLAIPIAALAGLAGMPDHRSGDGTCSSANDRALDWVTSHGRADRRPTQSANGSTLFSAGTCNKRNKKA